MAIQKRFIEYQHEGNTYQGVLAWDDAREGPRPGVAIAHTWAGRGDFEEGKAVALAELGYVAFAMDVFGKGVHGEGQEECSALIAPHLENRQGLQTLAQKAVETLREQPEVDADRCVAIGYCFGGLTVLDLARSGFNVEGVVSFHGLFNPPGNTQGVPITARVLCLHGYDDPMAQPDSMLALANELTEAGADWQIHAYGNTLHAFTNPEANDPGFGAMYDQHADRRSWQSLLNFLDEVLGQG